MVRDTAQHHDFFLAFPLPLRKEGKKKKGADTCSSYAPKANSLGSMVTTLRLSGWAEFPFIEKAIVTEENKKKEKKKKNMSLVQIQVGYSCKS